MINANNKNRGFTLVEVVLVILVVLFVLGSIVTLTISQTINGNFRVAPVTIPAGGTASFTYHVSKGGLGRTSPLSGRTINFRVAPSSILTITPTSGTTDGFGDIVVQVSSPNVEYIYGGNIWATDSTSGIEDNPVSFDVR